MSQSDQPGTESVSVGDRIPGFEFGPITRSGIVRYAGAGGDFNQVHHDEPFAQSKGYPSVFAMGLYPAGILARIVTDRFGLGRLRSFGVRFTSQVWPGETLRFSATVVGVREADEVLVDLETRAESSSGETKIVGRATVALDG